MVIDTAAVKDRVDLLDLIGRDTRLRKVASTRGGEWAGPCPRCGGRDRLHVQPIAGQWMCRACGGGQWRDAIDYVRLRDEVTFTDACRALGEVSFPRSAGRRQHQLPAEADVRPTGQWRLRAEAYVAFCEAVLWSREGKRALEYLHRRGLADETIQLSRFGFQPADAWEQGANWGLAADRQVWLPRGITIPWLVTGELWQIKVRRAGDPKYASIAGGHPFLYGADTLAERGAAMLVEGEFDAALVHQEAKDLVGAATLGSCSKSLTGEALRLMEKTALTLVAYDNDAEGQKGATRITARLSRSVLVSVPIGKDPTEFRAAGGRIRDWVQFELERARMSNLSGGRS